MKKRGGKLQSTFPKVVGESRGIESHQREGSRMGRSIPRMNSPQKVEVAGSAQGNPQMICYHLRLTEDDRLCSGTFPDVTRWEPMPLTTHGVSSFGCPSDCFRVKSQCVCTNHCVPVQITQSPPSPQSVNSQVI